MSASVSNLLYLVSGVLFILALRGLSHPTTSRQGNLFGMVGMGLAILTTLAFGPPAGVSGWILVFLGLAIGGGIGAVIAQRVAMTQMPQLVAIFHAGVGLAAVAVAAAAPYSPPANGIRPGGTNRGGPPFQKGPGGAGGAPPLPGPRIPRP